MAICVSELLKANYRCGDRKAKCRRRSHSVSSSGKHRAKIYLGPPVAAGYCNPMICNAAIGSIYAYGRIVPDPDIGATSAIKSRPAKAALQRYENSPLTVRFSNGSLYFRICKAHCKASTPIALLPLILIRCDLSFFVVPRRLIDRLQDSRYLIRPTARCSYDGASTLREDHRRLHPSGTSAGGFVHGGSTNAS